MRISLLRFSLLQFFKTFQKYLAYAILCTIYFVTAIFSLANAILCTIHFITAINLPNASFSRSQKLHKARTLCNFLLKVGWGWDEMSVWI